MFVVAGFAVPGWAEFRTVLVYDPSGDFNDADQSCAYSHSTGDANSINVITLATMQSLILAVDPNFGGVVDFEDYDSNYYGAGDDNFIGDDIIRAKYGIPVSKKLDIDGGPRSIGIRGPGESSDLETPISGATNSETGYMIGMGSSMGYHFVMGNIVGGAEGEKVVVFGGTILEEIDDPAGIHARAYFSDGSWVEANAGCGDATPNDQDTFFGFIAPPKQYITQVTVGTPGAWLNLDDLGFITDANGFLPSSNAGPDQLGVQLWDASSPRPGVTLAGSVALPEGGENYTYAWSGGFTGGTTTGATPTVYFTTTGSYPLTLVVTGDVNGVLYADTVVIEVVQSTSNAGGNQKEALGDAATYPGVTLEGSVNDPYNGLQGVETYTYAWTGGFVGGTTTGADPCVIFTSTGSHDLTLIVTGSIQGALASDEVTINVVEPALDAGSDQQVEKTIALYPGIRLNSTLSDPNSGETYTYLWSSLPSSGVTITDTDDADPTATFQSVVQEYTLTLLVTGTEGAYLVDTLTVNVEEDYVMVAHFAIDPNDYDGTTPANSSYPDSSTEGDPNNHTFITDAVGDGETGGVVDCGSEKAIKNDNNDPVAVHLDHAVGGFDNAAPHLDNVDAAITVALWIKNDYGRKVWAIEKLSTFAFGIDDGGDLRTQLWFAGAGDPNVLIRSKDGDDLGDKLHDENLKINADDDSGNGEHVWHHIAFTYDSFTGYVEQFLDGALIYDQDVGTGKLLETDPNKLYIGKNVTDFGESVEGLRGAMDDVRIYNYALPYHEIAGLAAMGDAATLVAAGDDVTVDPNELPYQLQGRFIRLAQGIPEVSPDEENEYFVVWETVDPNNDASKVIFTDPGDVETNVTFTESGTYKLRLTSFERLCDSDNESRNEMEITVLAASDCTGYLALGGANVADIVGDDCLVNLKDLAIVADKWGLSAP